MRAGSLGITLKRKKFRVTTNARVPSAWATFTAR
jgi:hypothetical protein